MTNSSGPYFSFPNLDNDYVQYEDITDAHSSHTLIDDNESSHAPNSTNNVLICRGANGFIAKRASEQFLALVPVVSPFEDDSLDSGPDNDSSESDRDNNAGHPSTADSTDTAREITSNAIIDSEIITSAIRVLDDDSMSVKSDLISVIISSDTVDAGNESISENRMVILGTVATENISAHEMIHIGKVANESSHMIMHEADATESIDPENVDLFDDSTNANQEITSNETVASNSVSSDTIVSETGNVSAQPFKRPRGRPKKNAVAAIPTIPTIAPTPFSARLQEKAKNRSSQLAPNEETEKSAKSTKSKRSPAAESSAPKRPAPMLMPPAIPFEEKESHNPIAKPKKAKRTADVEEERVALKDILSDSTDTESNDTDDSDYHNDSNESPTKRGRKTRIPVTPSKVAKLSECTETPKKAKSIAQDITAKKKSKINSAKSSVASTSKQQSTKTMTSDEDSSNDDISLAAISRCRKKLRMDRDTDQQDIEISIDTHVQQVQCDHVENEQINARDDSDSDEENAHDEVEMSEESDSDHVSSSSSESEEGEENEERGGMPRRICKETQTATLVELNYMKKSTADDGSYKVDLVMDKTLDENGVARKKVEKQKLIWTKNPHREAKANTVKFIPDRSISPRDPLICSEPDSLAIFTSIMSDEICEKIARYTNLYASKMDKKAKGARKWTDVDATEIRAFIGCQLLLGVSHKTRFSGTKIFTTNWHELNLPVVLAFSRDRYLYLLQAIRFSEITGDDEDSKDDRLIKIREIFDPIIENSKKLVDPGSVITVDETLLNFKGRCGFTQYLKSKPGKYGIKVWCACDSKTGYVLNAQIYSGKQGAKSETDQGRRVVLDMVKPYFDTNRVIVMDNFFTSIRLADELKSRSLGLVGTVKENTRGIPKELYAFDLNVKLKASRKDKKSKRAADQDSIDAEVHRKVRNMNTTLFKPKSAFLFTKDLTVLKTQVKPKRCVYMLSSIHHSPMVSSDLRSKPEIMLFYNKGKFGVDLLGQCVKNFSTKHATRRWPFRVFMWLMDIAAFNASIVYRTALGEKKPWYRRDFLMDLALRLIEAQIQRRCKPEWGSRSNPQVQKAKRAAFAAMLMKDPTGKQAERLLGDNEAEDAEKGSEVEKKTHAQCEHCGLLNTFSLRVKVNPKQSTSVSVKKRKPSTIGRVFCYAGRCKKRTNVKCTKCNSCSCPDHRHQESEESEGFLCSACFLNAHESSD